MSPLNPKSNLFIQTNFMETVNEYMLDAFQRSVLYLEALNKRGNNYFKHIEEGKPPVLTFDYEIIEDGRMLDRPVNFSLTRISDRRTDPEQGRGKHEKRHNPVELHPYDPKKRPIIISDPRAGHGSGIGGSKRDSEIGMALNEGHPVYFILFDANPVPGQTFADVHRAHIRFIETVIKRHPEAAKPAFIGNCQAGWAAALIGADRPDITGPMVFNGSPLSYWAGVDGKNPMRYRGGLFGGVWLTSLWSDLGNGIFDGANLVAGFEDLNPANTIWDKNYYLYANVDKEEKRYLDFERWWNGFFMLTRDEIHYIVDELFVGNRLEKGLLELDGRKIDLRNLKSPVLVFASSGDNITPPQQALNWIPKVWGSVEEIKKNQQVIVYLLHDTIGHLGIFVSGKVSKKEHKEIIASIDLIEYLSPGLYEMVISEKEEPGTHSVRFEERGIEDILALDDGLLDEDDFHTVAALSKFNDRLYRTFVSPWVRMAVNEWSADLIRNLHPLRVSCYSFSDANPWMMPLKFLTPVVNKTRKPVSQNNPLVAMEKSVSKIISDSLNMYRDIRDQTQEFWFKSIYGNRGMLSYLKEQAIEEDGKEEVCEESWLKEIDKGGFTEGVVRIMLMMAHVDEGLQRRVLKTYDEVVAADKRLKVLKEEDFKQIIRQQSCILNADEKKALKALSTMIPKKKDRSDAMAIAERIALADHEIDKEEKKLLDRIRKALDM